MGVVWILFFRPALVTRLMYTKILYQVAVYPKAATQTADIFKCKVEKCAQKFMLMAFSSPEPKAPGERLV